MNFAIIFDMDGVIVNSSIYHEKAWKLFCDKYHLKLDDEDIQYYVRGKTNKDTLDFLFQKDVPKKEIDKYTKEKELIFQDIYKDNIKPIEGLMDFLEILKVNKINTAIATSAPTENIDFVINTLQIEKYFNIIINEKYITKGKPDPEIYIKTSSYLHIDPKNCIVFEDSIPGIRSALNAGMKVIGVVTTHKKEELIDANFVIDNFKNITLNQLYNLF